MAIDVWFPTSFSFSNTNTFSSYCARFRAMKEPIAPAPMTIISLIVIITIHDSRVRDTPFCEICRIFFEIGIPIGKACYNRDMRFELDEKAKAHLEELFQMHEDNALASSLLNAYLEQDHTNDKKLLGGELEIDPFALPKLFAKSISVLDVAESPYIREKFNLGHFDEIDEKVYENNPYYRLLRGVSLSHKGVHLGKRVYAPFEGFLYDEIHAEKENLFQEISPFGYFPNGFEAPAIEKNGRIWMSLIPHEIHTMAKPIQEASGKVLTFGLGLGYYAFMCSQKEDVSSVTIVEKDPSIIQVFEKALLPLFPHKEKIHIVKQDAFDFVQEADLSSYDYRFVDLYYDEQDGLPIYLKFLKEEKAKGIRFSYWIEGSILVYLRRFLFSLMEEETEGVKDEYYSHEDFIESLFYDLHFHLKNRVLKTEEDIDELLSPESLKAIAKAIA